MSAAEHDLWWFDNLAEPGWGVQVAGGILRTHAPGQCSGEHCSIHNPSPNHMRAWPANWRGDRGLLERLCECSVGHPDFDHVAHVRRTRGQAAASAESTHGCCGCCAFDLKVEGLPARWAPDSEGYAVVSDGSIWSFWRGQGPKRGNVYVLCDQPVRKLKPRTRKGKGDYVRVNLGASVEWYIHRLAWTTWRGPIPEGLQVRHLDGDPRNNAIYNLAVGTQADNEDDKDRHGTRPKGAGHSNSKLTEPLVKKARALWIAGTPLDEVVALLDIPVSRGSVHSAVIGKTWRHVTDPPPFAPGRGRQQKLREVA